MGILVVTIQNPIQGSQPKKSEETSNKEKEPRELFSSVLYGPYYVRNQEPSEYI